MKILYFYPENPLLFTQGNNARANKLLEYFKSRNIEVDFVGEETKDFTIQDAQELVKKELVKRAFLLKLFNRKKNPCRKCSLGYRKTCRSYHYQSYQYCSLPQFT